MAIGKAASVFILYCTAWYVFFIDVYSEELSIFHTSSLLFFCSSNNFALQAKRKTLAASDVLSALNDMEFDQFVPELKSFLEGV